MRFSEAQSQQIQQAVRSDNQENLFKVLNSSFGKPASEEETPSENTTGSVYELTRVLTNNEMFANGFGQRMSLLGLAASLESPACFLMILAHIADEQITQAALAADDHGALRSAAYYKRYALVEILLENYYKDEPVRQAALAAGDHSVLRFATSHNSLVLVELLLKHYYKGEPIRQNALAGGNHDALRTAVENGYLEVADCLLKYYTDNAREEVLADDEYVINAVINNHLEMLKCLLEARKSSPPEDDPHILESPLARLAKFVRRVVLGPVDKTLKQKVPERDFYKVLQPAVLNGFTDIIVYLLESGYYTKKSKQEALARNNYYVFRYAACHGRIDITVCLLAHYTDEVKQEALAANCHEALKAAVKYDYLKIVECLLGHYTDEAKQEALAVNQHFVLGLAARKGYLEMVVCLLGHYTDEAKQEALATGHKNRYLKNYAALHDAAMNGHADVVECLLKHYTDEAREKALAYDNQMVIRLPLSRGYVSVIKCLLTYYTNEARQALKGILDEHELCKRKNPGVDACLLEIYQESVVQTISESDELNVIEDRSYFTNMAKSITSNCLRI